MPLIGYKCPPDVPTAGRTNDPTYCFYECPHKCLPTAVLATIWQNHTTNEHQGDMITPSALGGCPRSLVLERTTDYYEEPQKLYYAVRGSLIHGFLENSNVTDTVTEQRVYKTLVSASGRTYHISGRFDYLSLRDKTLEDYKTTQDKATWFLYNTGAKPDHIWQTNVYRWLLNGGHLDTFDGPVVHYEIDHIKIHYIFMGKIISTGSTVVERVSDYDKPSKPYKLQRSMVQDGWSKRGQPIWKITIDIPEVPIYDDATVEAHVRTHGDELADAFHLSAARVRHVLDDKDARWQCDWCAGRDACMKIEQGRHQVSIFQKPTVHVTAVSASTAY